jgi:hypothetical protein
VSQWSHCVPQTCISGRQGLQPEDQHFNVRQLWFAHKIHSVNPKHPQATHKIMTEKSDLNEWLLLSFPSLTSFNLLIVGVECYRCTQSHLTKHTHTHLVGLLWTSDQPDTETSTSQHNTHDRQASDAPSRIWTWNPSKEADADPRLRSCSHWDQLSD